MINNAPKKKPWDIGNTTDRYTN